MKRIEKLKKTYKELGEEIRKLEEEKTGIVNYAGYEWYIINDDGKNFTLLMKEKLSKEKIEKYFTNKNMVDKDGDVRFNYDVDNIWWRDSYIRHVLNSNFLAEFNLNHLNVMTMTVEYNRKKITTKDYVRLLTIDEVKKLTDEQRKLNSKYGYWTMNPCDFGGSNAFEFYVNSNGVTVASFVIFSGGVRPVVSVKKEALDEE